MKLSVIVPSLDGRMPRGLLDQIAGRTDVELVAVTGVSPVGRARNQGLRRATGEWIAWADADDEVAAGWLEAILGALAEEPDVVAIDAERIGWEQGGDLVWGRTAREATADRLLDDVYRDDRRTSALWLTVTRRTLWAGCVFDETIRILEDYLLLPKILAKARSCRYLPQRLYRYVCNPASLVNARPAGLDAAVLRVWERRLAECPREHLGPCRWGVALSAYWLCRRAAQNPSAPAAPDEATVRRARTLLRLLLPHLIREVLVAHDIPFKTRAKNLLRFIIAASPFAWGWRKKPNII